MINESELTSVVETLKTVPTIYQDVLQPGAREVGKLIEKIPRAINVALSPLDKWIMCKENNLEETKLLLAKKLSDINSDKIVAPSSFVAVPAIQALSYSMDNETLRDMYANLLAKSMNTDTKDNVHPAYVEIIKQLSPDDAILFRTLCSLDYRPIVDIQLQLDNGNQVLITGNTPLFITDQTCDFNLCLDNLIRLHLTIIPNGQAYGKESVYEPMESVCKENINFNTYKRKFPNAVNVDTERKKIDITPFGQNFYNICIR